MHFKQQFCVVSQWLCALLWLAASALLTAANAQAVSSGTLQPSTPGAVSVAATVEKLNLRHHWVQAILSADHGLSPDALMALPESQFSVQTGKVIPNLGADKVLLLRLKLHFEQGDAVRMLDIPMARLDDVWVHYRYADGPWHSSHMGDRVPYTEWPMLNTHPAQQLVGTGQTMDLLLLVRHAGRFTTPVWLKSDRVFRAEQLRWSIYNGLTAGFMLAMALVCVASWRAFGNSAFNWVAVQLLLYAFGVIAYQGFGDMLLWGDANPWWRDQGKFVSSIMILAMLLPLFAATLGLRTTDRLLWIVCQCAGVLALLAGYAMPLVLSAQGRVAAGALLSLLVLGGAAWLCTTVVRRHERIGFWLSLCLGLYSFCIVLTAIDNTVHIESVDVTTVAPVGYALGTLLMIYGLYTSHRFGKNMLPQKFGGDLHYDPATGLPNVAGLANELARHLLDLRARHASATLLWVRLDGAEKLAQDQGREIFEAELVKLSADLLGCLASTETLARLDDDTFAMVAAEHPAGEEARQLASQVLARCMAAFEPRDGVSVRLVVLPIPAIGSSVPAITHLCERALSSAPPERRIITLNTKGQFVRSAS